MSDPTVVEKDIPELPNGWKCILAAGWVAENAHRHERPRGYEH